MKRQIDNSGDSSASRSRSRRNHIVENLNSELWSELQRLQGGESRSMGTDDQTTVAVTESITTSPQGGQLLPMLPAYLDEFSAELLVQSPEVLSIVSRFLSHGMQLEQIVGVIREAMAVSRRDLVILWVARHLEIAHQTNLVDASGRAMGALLQSAPGALDHQTVLANNSSRHMGMWVPPSVSGLEGLHALNQAGNGQWLDFASRVEDLPKASRENSRSRGMLLFVPSDEHKLSKYLCLVRKQVEFFAKRRAESTAQGRNKPIKIGQVGIRCIHCRNAPNKTTGSEYFPGQLIGIYPVVRKLALVHLEDKCTSIPPWIRSQVVAVKDDTRASVGGRSYWVESATALGVKEDDGGGLCFATSFGT